MKLIRTTCWLLATLSLVLASVAEAQTNSASALIEAAGQVEALSAGSTNWHAAVVGATLQAGDRVRTRAQSRAAVQLSDRSVVRLDELTTLEILPPRKSEKKRFGLSQGAIYFFNREKPADVEFDTPLAAGAIRGTEFLLEAQPQGAVHLALIDGLVTLASAREEVSLKRGEEVRLAPGQPAKISALVNVTGQIQWALYYPAIVNPAELQFSVEEQKTLATALKNYRAGDLLAALAGWPEAAAAESATAKILHAQLELAVGQVDAAQKLLAGSSENPAVALNELIGVVRGEKTNHLSTAQSASAMLANSYAYQAATDLDNARRAAQQAVALAPDFGFAHARLAELEFAFGYHNKALAELNRALELSPRLAPAFALRGFVLLEQGDYRNARQAFDQTRALDAALGLGWLGQGLCQMRVRDYQNAIASFQAAAALEPTRAIYRSYLGKAASARGDTKRAEKELNLAKKLDPNDPTAWLYSALDLWQNNEINGALRDLQHSLDLNDQRAVYRSRLLLDQDRSVRSADLAAVFNDAGLPEVSQHTASRSVSEDYANFSGHLFLANSYQAADAANPYNLRLETARQSELLMANLLAPPGGGNLSQLASQQDHLQYFDPKPAGVSTLTSYGSGGDWLQNGTVFGTVDGFSYAVDTSYQSLNGQQVNNSSEQQQYFATMKQRVTTADDFYLQVGWTKQTAGDLAQYYYPTQANPSLHISEVQQPSLYAGWTHNWSPEHHTLLLLGCINDQFNEQNGDEQILFLQKNLFGGLSSVQSGTVSPPVNLYYNSDVTLYSAELQHIFETPDYSLVIGTRNQYGVLDTSAQMTRFSGTNALSLTDQSAHNDLNRASAYAYGSWLVFEPLRLTAGASYDHLTYPQNVDLPPISSGNTSRDLISPKVGLIYEPWQGGSFHASYTKSLGGLYFDNSVRLEPTQVAGFNQAFRSLIPESVAGLVPGTKFTTTGVGFDQVLPGGRWAGVGVEQLSSSGSRDVGAFSSFIPLLSSSTATTTHENLNFRERNLTVYAGQLIGENLSLGGRYRVSQTKLDEWYPQIPNSTPGSDQLEGTQRATLQTLALTANFNHRSGLFAQWESIWYHQDNSGYSNPSLPTSDFWQQNIGAGYRFAQRRAELRLGILNLFDQNYNLNPLNLHANMARGRTFTTSLRLNF